MKEKEQNNHDALEFMEGHTPEEQLADAEKLLAEVRCEKKLAKRHLIQSALLAFTALVAIIIVAIAWFANNRRIIANSNGLQSTGSSYELASMGNLGKFDLSDYPLGETVEIDGKTYYETSGGGTSVEWMLSSDSNFSNYTGENEANEDTLIRPGSYGTLTFYIIPKRTGTLNLHFSFDTTAYTHSSDGREQIATETKDNINVAAVPTDDEMAVDLLRGHILLFQNLNDAGYYSGRITADGMDFGGDVTAGEPVKVTFYWIWPIVFDKYMNISSTKTLCDPSSADYTELLAEMDTNENLFFYDPTNASINFDPQHEPDADELNQYRRWYNMGDEKIGTKISYVRLELSADEQ